MENPVLKEAKQKGLISSNATPKETTDGAAALSSANPVLQEYYGLNAKKDKLVETEPITQTVNTDLPGLEKDTPNFFERVASVLKAAGKGTASNASNAISTKYATGQAQRTAQNKETLAEYEYNLARAQKVKDDMLAENLKKPNSISEEEIRSQQAIIDDWQRKIDAMSFVIDEKVQEKATEASNQVSDALLASMQKDADAAKKGLGVAGQLAVDAGIGGAQLVGDVAVSRLLGTKASVPMAFRAFGGGAQTARNDGASLNEQVAYGLSSAALSVLTEKIANIAKPFKNVFGEGLVDKLAPQLVSRLTQTPVGKIALSALSEGGEEFIEAVFQPILQKATYKSDATFDLGQALYDAAIGTIIGGVGASGGLVYDAAARKPASQAVDFKTAGKEGNDATENKTPQSAIKSDSTAKYTQEDYRRDLDAVETAERILAEAKANNADPLQIALLQSEVDNAKSKIQFVNKESSSTSINDSLGSARAGFDPYSQLQNQSSEFYPEGPNAVRPTDMPTTNFEGRNIPKSASTIYGAQGTTESGVQLLERDIADGKIAFDTIKDTDSVAKAQTTISELTFDGALEHYRNAVASNVATKDNTTLGQQLLLKAMRDGNEAATAELLSLYTRNSTTAAQALQAQSIFRKLSPEGQLVAIQKALDALNSKYGTDVKLTDQEISDFINAETQEARQKVADQIMDRCAESVPGTFKAKFDTLRYLAMLGNPRTHIRNILGNTLFQVPVAVKNRVGAALEGVAYAVSGGKTERTKSLFGVNPFGKLAAEARADWVNAKDFLEQSNKYQEGKASLSAIEQRADAFSNENLLGRGINAAADFNSKALQAEDTAAKKWIYTQSLAGYLKANGCRSIKDASPNLLNKARNYAAQEALRGTFTDSSEISNAVSSLGQLTQSENKAIQALGYVVEGVLPFKRTPANIAVRAVEYSPIGAMLGAVETVRGATSGDIDQVTAGLDRVAAGLTGSALLAAGFLASGAGYVTGGESEDKDQQGFDELTGHQNYALELKNGKSVTLDWLAPEAIPFFMGVELYESMLDGGVSWDEAWETIKNAASPMLEMSMLQGLNDTFENAAYAKNRGDSVLGSLIVSALTNYVTQIFPTVGGQIERSTENLRMTTYTEKDGKVPTDLQYTIGKVSQKIPGWDYQQIPYIDAWGRTESTGDKLSRFVNNVFNPAYVSQVDIGKVESELQRLKDATGNSSVFPDKADRSFEVDGAVKNLTANEYIKYAQKLGQTKYQVVNNLVNNNGYKTLSDEERVEAISYAYQYANAIAKMDVSNYVPKSGWAKSAVNSVLPPDAYILYSINKDRNGNGATDATETALTLNEISGLTDQQKGQQWAAAHSTTNENKNPFTGSLPNSGMSVKQSIDVYDRYRVLSNNDNLKPKEKAEAFKHYIYSLHLPAKQLQAVKDVYTFWGSYPVAW